MSAVAHALLGVQPWGRRRSVAPNHQMRVQKQFGPRFRKLEKSRHGRFEFVANAAALDHDLRSLFHRQAAAQRSENVALRHRELELVGLVSLDLDDAGDAA